MSEKILSHGAIRELRKIHELSLVHVILCDMAEKYRRIYRQRRRDARRRPKTHLKPTDYLTEDQFAKLVDSLVDMDNSRSRGTLLIIIMLAESGLRSEEAIEIKYKDLPIWHGHNEIEVRKAKGRWRRTVVISKFLANKIKRTARLGWTKESYFLTNEQGKKFTYNSFYSRVRRAGERVGMPWLHPHVFRHTFSTHLKAVCGDDLLVSRQLGHRGESTTGTYVHGDSEILRCEMEKFHNRLWSGQKGLFGGK